MATDTVDQCVRSYQRKAIVVVADRLKGNLPTLHGMAAFAIRSHLPSVDVCVTVSAVCAHVMKHHAGVARRAGNIPVHTPQRVTGLVVPELGIGANRFPTRVGVAVLAWNRDGSVRIRHPGSRRRRAPARPRLVLL